MITRNRGVSTGIERRGSWGGGKGKNEKPLNGWQRPALFRIVEAQDETSPWSGGGRKLEY